MQNYEKHALRVSQVIAAVAKVSCKHGLWLVARVNKNPGDIISGASDVRDRIRTHDLLVRSQTLYPAELHVHSQVFACNSMYCNCCGRKCQ